MAKPMPTRLLGAIALALILLASGCRSGEVSTAESAPPETSMSLLDRQLLEAIELETKLDDIAAQTDVRYEDVQRRFQEVAQLYNSIISRNPDSLETRLLYGKLLMRYGDGEGAREQLLLAAKIDPQVAVIHQQLSTFYAEEADHTRALAYALNAVEIEPATAAYQFGVGQVLAAFRQTFLKEEIFTPEQIDAQMLNAFATAKDLEPDTLPLQFRYGEAFYDVEAPDWETALAHWESLRSHPGLTALEADAIRLHMARCLIELGRTAEARLIAESVQSPELKDSFKVLF